MVLTSILYKSTDSILLNINSIGSGLGCTILPAYVAPLGVSNTVVRPLDVELPSLDLFVSYRKNTESVGVKDLLINSTKYFILIKI